MQVTVFASNWLHMQSRLAGARGPHWQNTVLVQSCWKPTAFSLG